MPKWNPVSDAACVWCSIAQQLAYQPNLKVGEEIAGDYPNIAPAERLSMRIAMPNRG